MARRRNQRRSGMIPVLVILLQSWPVDANGDATNDAAALKQFENGRLAFDRGDLAVALAAFSASMQSLGSPNTRLYIARCQRGLGKPASASTSYKLAAREAADRLSVTGDRRYTATREAALVEAAEIEKSIPHLSIALPPDAPASTQVLLDESPIPPSSLTMLEVDPGPHALVVEAPRRSAFRRTFDLGEGERKTVEVSLPRLPTATLEVVLKIKPAGIAMEIDSQPVEPGALQATRDVDTGPHRIVVRAPGYQDFSWSRSLVDGERQRIVVALEPSVVGRAATGTPKWLFFGAAAVGVAALGTGTYFALDAGERADVEQARDPLLRDRAEQDDIRRESTIANVLFVSGAIAAVTSGVLLLFTDWTPGRRATALATGAPALSGRF